MSVQSALQANQSRTVISQMSKLRWSDGIFLIGTLQGLVNLCNGAVDGLVDQSQVLLVLQTQELEQRAPMVRMELVQTDGLP